ncbi:MAG: hypothetical protein ACLTDR_00040 [Adlercreutzia equolifaciens]
MEAWLTGKLDSAPRREGAHHRAAEGEKAELRGHGRDERDAHVLMRYKVRTNYDDKRINNALLQLESALALDEPPMRIECFDISTIHGSYTVASMVVFTGTASPTRTSTAASRSRRRSTRRTTSCPCRR